ncbi:MAG TPA: ABC transporter ATP-binding protein [Syntrophales bacterium]|jgi:branched-chain amino acid transport system ATP-binding protein|nr:ABC transporter ATP-binding protein [Syntrophales bacterium]HON22162.1 ABC transporter ATP-binding protein [Syntrophales bacterium]HOU78657.1 ABC transporter ATP-binding protein [Syntrophales bacterium]HPC31580.1 ABC transporter ATP-binding protein [Syntrophales bacterium]HQG34320.1 ABC transporter ATP-binding protein [Syntrophales bacterium]
MALLEVREVTKKFGELVANDRVSFTVEAGTIVGLIGPNGAGKTTLFNCITGLFPADGGAVFLDGREITALKPYEIARRGAVRTFQVVRPLKDMTVFDNVLVGAFLKTGDKREAAARAAECVRLCNLDSLQDRPAGELSIGGKKRLEMARALATRPKLLMLDEVMAGMTSTEIKASLDVILRLRETGLTMMIVEHVMEGIMPIADKVVVLDGGVKIAEDVPGNIVNDERVIEAYLGAKYSQRFKARKEGGNLG